MQGVLSRASFRRPPLSGQKTFSVLSPHISNIYAKKRGQQIDEVAGDFNGTAWRCSNRDNISTIDEAFADCTLPMPPGPAPLWRPGSIPNNCADVCGFLGKCACTAHFPSPAKLLAYVQPIKVSIMRHGSTWISSIGAAVNHIMMSMTDEFSSKNVLRHVHMGTRKDASVKP